MIYSNPEFFALLLATVVAYRLAWSQRGRFAVLLAASTAFYAWAGWFDLLVFEAIMLLAWFTVFFSTVYPKRRKQLTGFGIVLIVLHLVTWKYLPWLSGGSLHWIVPLGVSFYTLQKIAYLVDVYRGTAKPISLREYLLFNGFFPQLIAGPITRASDLIPQLRKLSPIRARNLWRGIGLFMLGFFKKVAIADNLGIYVDFVFERPHIYGRLELFMAVLAFTCQLWADFAGYTDMGRGAAMIFGIELPENFESPFLARGPSEFWRRWHITLSEWLRDYLFIPLWMRYQNIFGGAPALVITMVLAGLWHGADWLFVLYGAYWGSLLLAEHYWRRTSLFKGGFTQLPVWLQRTSAVSLMFSFTLVSRLMFRSGNLFQLREFLDAFLYNPGPSSAYNIGLFYGLIAVSFLIQIATYRRLEAGALPLWRRLCDSWIRRINRQLERSPVALAAAGVALGIALSLTFVGSVSLSLKPEATRAFIYWSGVEGPRIMD